MTEEKVVKTKKKVRRPSPELRKQIKERQKEDREKAKTEVIVPVEKKAEEGKISFDQWWMKINKKIKLRYHLKEIIWVDFKARGADKMELESKYDEMLKLFGYTW